jgi:hypothetical protein
MHVGNQSNSAFTSTRLLGELSRLSPMSILRFIG